MPVKGVYKMRRTLFRFALAGKEEESGSGSWCSLEWQGEDILRRK